MGQKHINSSDHTALDELVTQCPDRNQAMRSCKACRKCEHFLGVDIVSDDMRAPIEQRMFVICGKPIGKRVFRVIDQ